MTTTRFAPSPTGLLHLGHAYAALFAANRAGQKGRFLVRLEDIDQTRSRAGTKKIFSPIWLGSDYPGKSQFCDNLTISHTTSQV